MEGLLSILEGLYNITGKRMAVVAKEDTVSFPPEQEAGIAFDEAVSNINSNLKGFSIYPLKSLGEECFFCLEAEEFEQNKSIDIAVFALDAIIHQNSSLHEGIKHIVEMEPDSINFEFCERVQKKYSTRLGGYVVLLEPKVREVDLAQGCFEDIGSCIKEIASNIVELKVWFEHGSNYFMIVGDRGNNDIEDACESLCKNILAELFLECTAAVGGRLKHIKNLPELYRNCLEALRLNKVFGLKETVLDFEKMDVYKIIYNLDDELKNKIHKKIFSRKLEDFFDNEMDNTIEEFFKNNLNLTDTANKLYIHRNTLLYRLDKINKLTGYDLKKFEDSWFFKLAWIIHKEKSQN